MTDERFRIIAIVFIGMILSTGCFGDDDTYDKKTPQGFTMDDLRIPDFDNGSYVKKTFHKNQLNISSDLSYCEINFSLSWSFFDGVFYTHYGQTLSISFNNDMERRVLIYLVEAETSYGKSSSKDVAMDVEPMANNIDLGLLHLGGPDSVCNFTYNISVSFFVFWKDSFFDVGEQKIVDNLMTSTEIPVYHNENGNSISDTDMEELIASKIILNNDVYFNSVNSVYDPGLSRVRNKAVRIASEHPGTYNIWQVFELYEFVKENISYVSDPSNVVNYWASPNETLSIGGGDCEDKSLLLGAFISSVGGTCRLYFTEDHAFCAVYIGSDPSVKSFLEDALERYYGTRLSAFFIRDEFGYWAVGDPTGAVYLGGYPSGSSPVEHMNDPERTVWPWEFSGEIEINVVDIVGTK